MKALVTGATGFVGTALVAHLQRLKQMRIVAAVRASSLLEAPIEAVVVGDINAATDWSPAVRGADVVVHLAGRAHADDAPRATELFRRVNVEGTLALAIAAAGAGVKRFVFVSSVKVNGETGLFTEADLPHPQGPYGISKHEAELGLARISRETGMQIVIVRPPLVYGPSAKANFATLVRAVGRGLPLPLGAVDNRRSFVGIDNLVDFLTMCLDHPAAAGETFMVSDGEDCSTPDLIRRIAAAMHKPARLVPIPCTVLAAAASLVGKRDIAQRLIESLQVDISKARMRLGWNPRLSLEEGIQRAVAVAA